jgi:ribose 5-phosphate isomerase B
MKQYDLITETDARRMEPGTTVALAAGGCITPLARETLRDRRITVVTDGLCGEDLTALVPVAPPRTIAIGSDHTGVALKKRIVQHLRGLGLKVADTGAEGMGSADYPDVAAAVARAVARGEADAGIVIDGAGIGSAIAANKVAGIRAAMCSDETIARYSREHNGANVMTLGATLLAPDAACRIVDVWMAAAIREPRYIRRLAKIRRLERR